MFHDTKLLILLAAGFVMFACQNEPAGQDVALVSGTNRLTFTATIDDAGSRTSLDGSKISWNAAEEINIFYGASEGSKFVSQNTEPSQSVTFSGTLTAFTGTTEAGEPNSFWAIYPYDESNSSSGSSVTAYLPENQVGVPNNVPDKALMMVAKAPGLALSFKQVCARLRVIVDTPDIRKIEIRGNNDETIAGSAVITMNSQGLPEWQDAGTGAGKVIELLPSSGTTFEAGETDYFVALLPQTFSTGFTMTCYKDGIKGSYSTDAVTFGRNQVKPVRTSKVTEWAVDQPNNVIYYTSIDEEVVMPCHEDAFGANMESNEYVDGRGVITFDGDITTIGNEAFEGCSALTSVQIPGSVTSLGYLAFRACSGLTSFIIPGSVTSIGDGAFELCEGLVSIVIPGSVTSIGDYSFSGCSELTSISVSPDNGIYDSRNDCNAIIRTEDNVLIAGCKSTVIPNSVTGIGDRAFASCVGLTSLEIPTSVTSIGESAFSGCFGLVSIKIPDSVTSIGDRAFEDCRGLASVEISGSITSIGEEVFGLCSALTSVEIPDSVTGIGKNAFYYCTGLISVKIPKSVTSIGEGAFCYCTSLASVSIPSSVTSIGSGAFLSCTGLEYVCFFSDTPPLGCESAFGDTNDCPIYVPALSRDTYYQSWWGSDLADRVQVIPSSLVPLPEDFNPDNYLVYRANPTTIDDGINYTHLESHFSDFSAAKVEIKFQFSEGSNKMIASDNYESDYRDVLKIENGSLVWIAWPVHSDDADCFRFEVPLGDYGFTETSQIVLVYDSVNATFSINEHVLSCPGGGEMSFACMFADYLSRWDEGRLISYKGVPDGSKLYYLKLWDSDDNLIDVSYATKAVNPNTGLSEFCWCSYVAEYAPDDGSFGYEFANDAENQGGYEGFMSSEM